MRKKFGQSWALLSIAAICGLLLGAGLTQVFLRHVGHDQSWCIYAANLMLHGVPLDGDQLVEVNPPFIIWFSALPVFMGNLLHIGILNGFRVFFDLVEVGSLVCTGYLFQRLFRPSKRAFWLFLLALIFATLWLIKQDSLGQREHFLVLLLLPYLVLTSARIAREGLPVLVAILVGVCGGLAICLKPQHALAIVAVELLTMWASKSLRTLLRPEMLSLVAALLLYALSVQLFGRAYLVNVAPRLFLTYSAMNVPFWAVLHSSFHVALGILVGWALLLATNRRSPPFRPLAKVLGVASIGSWAAYLQQAKGWSYQEIPAGMFAVLFLAVVTIGLIDHWLPTEWPVSSSTKTWPAVACVLLCTLLSGALDLRYGKRGGFYEVKKRELNAIYARYPAGIAVSYYSTEPWELPLVIEQQKVLGQRFNYYWMMPAIIKGLDPAKAPNAGLSAKQTGDLAAYQMAAMTDDLQRWKPSVIVIDECGPDLCSALHREHIETVLGWFLTDSRFRSEWAHYQPVDRVDQLDVFQRIR